MNHEIRKLQILNDLIAQTLDVLQQRAAILPQGTPFVPNVQGLTHTPYGYPYQVAFTPWNTQVVQGTPWNTQTGLNHTGFDPRFGYNAPQSYGMTPGYNVAPQYTPSFGFHNYQVQPQYGVPQYGLNHTPVDPRVQMGRNWNVGTQMVPGILPTIW